MSVSIHATLAGGDIFNGVTVRAIIGFLSTPPSRVATYHLALSEPFIDVSIHATLAGGDSVGGTGHSTA